MIMKHYLTILILFLTGLTTSWSQAPGTTPVKVSLETQMLHGRKYYVHIVEKGQTVYSIARAYKVQSYDAVTHVDIHYLHPGDTVWLPVRGQFSDAAIEIETEKASQQQSPEKPTTTDTPQETAQPASRSNSQQPQAPPTVRKTGNVIKVAVMMPLHLDQLDQISTSKFDVEQRGKKSYRQFEFIEFYEGMLLALDRLAEDGINVELNVVDVSDNSPSKVEEAFHSHHVEQSDFVVALLLRDAFDKAAELAQQAGIYIVNPMATRSELCTTNPYMVKIQPSLEGQLSLMLVNMKVERPNGHLYIIHSNAAAEKPVLAALKQLLDTRGDIPYTVFNWSQSAKLASVLKKTPGCHVLSIYDQDKDNNRVFTGNLLNRLTALKDNPPNLYTLNDWTRDFLDVDFSQLQQLNYHTYTLSWDMTNEVHVNFLKAYRNRFSTEPSSMLASTGYDLMLYIVGGINLKNNEFWLSPSKTLPTLMQPLHLSRHGAGLENDKAQLYRMENLRFVKATLKSN